MMSTVFSDYIVNATELRKNQKLWLQKACKAPVTVSYGHRQLAIVSREQISKLYADKFWMELVLKVSQELAKGVNSVTLAWVEYLSDEDKEKLHSELLACAIKSIITGNWVRMEHLLQDWEATAETERHPDIVKAVEDEETAGEYVSVE